MGGIRWIWLFDITRDISTIPKEGRMNKIDAIAQADSYLQAMGLPAYSELAAFVRAVAAESGTTSRKDTLAEIISAAQALSRNLPDADNPATLYEQDHGKVGLCRHCGLPKDFHKREGGQLVCHSPDSRPAPL